MKTTIALVALFLSTSIHYGFGQCAYLVQNNNFYSGNTSPNYYFKTKEIKIKLAAHFIQDENGERNFDQLNGINFWNALVDSLNYLASHIQKNNYYNENNEHPALQSKLVFVQQQSSSSQNGAYFYKHPENWSACRDSKEGCDNIHRRLSEDLPQYEKEGVVNVFFIEDLASWQDGISGPVANGLAENGFNPNSVCIFGNYRRFWGGQDIPNIVNDQAGLLLHEILHLFRISHEWSNLCVENPGYQLTDETFCGDNASNNVMGYNCSQNALLPCQIFQTHNFVRSGWHNNQPPDFVEILDYEECLVSNQIEYTLLPNPQPNRVLFEDDLSQNISTTEEIWLYSIDGHNSILLNDYLDLSLVHVQNNLVEIDHHLIDDQNDCVVNYNYVLDHQEFINVCSEQIIETYDLRESFDNQNYLTSISHNSDYTSCWTIFAKHKNVQYEISGANNNIVNFDNQIAYEFGDSIVVNSRSVIPLIQSSCFLEEKRTYVYSGVDMLPPCDNDLPYFIEDLAGANHVQWFKKGDYSVTYQIVQDKLPNANYANLSVDDIEARVYIYNEKTAEILDVIVDQPYFIKNYNEELSKSLPLYRSYTINKVDNCLIARKITSNEYLPLSYYTYTNEDVSEQYLQYPFSDNSLVELNFDLNYLGTNSYFYNIEEPESDFYFIYNNERVPVLENSFEYYDFNKFRVVLDFSQTSLCLHRDLIVFQGARDRYPRNGDDGLNPITVNLRFDIAGLIGNIDRCEVSFDEPNLVETELELRSISPNPLIHEKTLYLDIYSVEEKIVSYSVIELQTGMVRSQGDLSLYEGDNARTVDIDGLTSGYYVIKLYGQRETSYKLFHLME